MALDADIDSDRPATDDDGIVPLLAPERRRKVLSGLRLQLVLTGFIAAVVAALALTMVLLVSGIFGWLTPAIRSDLEWKARRGARELANETDLGIVLADPAVIARGFGEY